MLSTEEHTDHSTARKALKRLSKRLLIIGAAAGDGSHRFLRSRGPQLGSHRGEPGGRTLAKAGCGCPWTTTLRGIIEAEGLLVVVIRERLRVPSPTDDSAERFLSGFFGHVVFQLVSEATLGSRLTLALVEDAANVRGQGHVGQQVAGEQALAFVSLLTNELRAGFGQPDIATLDLSEAKHLQSFRNRQQVACFHLQSLTDVRQVSLTAEGLLGDGLHQT